MFTFACTGDRLGPMEGQAVLGQANPGPGRSQVARALTQEARMPIVQMKSLSPGEAQAAAAAANGGPGSELQGGLWLAGITSTVAVSPAGRPESPQ